MSGKPVHATIRHVRFKQQPIRRLDLMERLASAMRGEHLAALRSDDDLLAAIPELDGWEVWAGDGHAMAHATHDARNARDAHRSVHGIYRLEKLYLAPYRPTEVILQFIRWLRSTLFRPTCYRAALDLLRPLILKYL